MRIPKSFLYQLIIAFIISCILGVLFNNLIVNLIRTGIGINFKWLMRPAGFALAETSLPYKPSDTYAWALFIGWINSLKVILFSLILATLLGIIAGTARSSSNLLVKSISSLYVALIRQIPLLLQLFFWYFVAFLSLPNTPLEPIGKLLSLSNQSLRIAGVNISVEFCALLIGLTIFTGASIAEVVRGGLNSVNRGQWESFRSLGLNERLGLIHIIIPQSLPAIIPGLTSQYLNLAKNSTLAIAVGYADIYAVSDTTITQTGRAIEGFIILLASFLVLNLLITGSMNILNKLVMRIK